MRDVVRIEKRSTAQDAVGEPVLQWVFFVQRRAQVEQASGREVWSSEQRQGRVPTTVRMRFVPGVLPEMRLVLPARLPTSPEDRIFNILSAVDPDGLRVELVITAEELVEATP